ncbi:hypothetical protein OAE25_02695, partial [Verrucomicrobiales bacterium]|nr:hypothetical protein [Verrucomicrobiales bacterium]
YGANCGNSSNQTMIQKNETGRSSGKTKSTQSPEFDSADFSENDSPNGGEGKQQQRRHVPGS